MADVAPLAATVTVVVPVGPGDAPAPGLLPALAGLPDGSEVVMVFATATDAAAGGGHASTPPLPLRRAWAPAGRAAQQNVGAGLAAGAWLWFLHADSVLGPSTLPALSRFVAGQRGAMGYFDLRFTDGPRRMALNATGAWLRSRWLGLPFGDQGLVLPRAAFTALGGFDTTLAAGEDHDLVWRARRHGLRLQPLRAPLYTSARKYAARGWLRTTSAHLAMTARQAWRFSRAVPRP